MPGFFEALNNRSKKSKRHFVTIQGRQHEVSLEKKLEIIKNGEDKYFVKDSVIQLKKPKSVRYPLLHKDDKGYIFFSKNPYWVKSNGQGGYKWKAE